MTRALIFALTLTTFSAAAAGPTYIPIAAARAQSQGTTVTVVGLVTVPSGDFRSSTLDEGFALQDQTGGIWVSVKKNQHFKLGQKVRATGVLGTGVEGVQIAPASLTDVEALPGSKLRVATGQVGTVTLGFIISVEGTVTQAPVKDSTYGYKMQINDGTGAVQIYLGASTDIDPHAPYLQAGRNLRVTGFGNQYQTMYEVDPRSKHDLDPVSP